MKQSMNPSQSPSRHPSVHRRPALSHKLCAGLFASLHQGEVSSRQDGLCLVQRLQLICAGLLTRIEVVHQEVARLVQILVVRMGLSAVFCIGFAIIMVLRQIALGLGQGRLILRHRLGIGRALLGAILHQLLIILLRVLLFQLVLIHLRLQIIDHAVNHAHDTTPLLLLVSANLRGRRRSVNSVLLDLHESYGHSGASKTGRSRCGADVTAVSGVHLLLIAQHPLGSLLVLLRLVELGQSVLGELQDLHGRLILGGAGHVVIVLVLPVLGRLRNCLVQVLDALLEGSNLLLGVLDGGIQVAVCLIQPFLVVGQVLEPVLSLVEFLGTVRLLGVIVHLLFLQSVLHGVDHLNDFVEIHLLAPQSNGDQIQFRVRASRTHQLQRLRCNLTPRSLNLQQARSRQRLLEEVQHIVVVEDFDSVGNGKQLISASLLHCSVVLCLLLAILAELLRIPCISLQLLRNVRLLVLQLDNLHSQGS
mmetsp:Transcript_59362/g.127930  ORF Transcript_59362/g.127930 Transcript_59362/m.127930 type:complete len:476 (-) Transcript_59362:833-2260(-)